MFRPANSELADKCRVVKTSILLALRVEIAEPSFPTLLFGQGHPSFSPKNTQGTCGKSSMATILENFGALESSFEDEADGLPQLDNSEEDNLEVD
jgi:hypothetical protein